MSDGVAFNSTLPKGHLTTQMYSCYSSLRIALKHNKNKIVFNYQNHNRTPGLDDSLQCCEPPVAQECQDSVCRVASYSHA